MSTEPDVCFGSEREGAAWNLTACGYGNLIAYKKLDMKRVCDQFNEQNLIARQVHGMVSKIMDMRVLRVHLNEPKRPSCPVKEATPESRIRRLPCSAS